MAHECYTRIKSNSLDPTGCKSCSKDASLPKYVGHQQILYSLKPPQAPASQPQRKASSQYHHPALPLPPLYPTAKPQENQDEQQRAEQTQVLRSAFLLNKKTWIAETLVARFKD